MNVESNVRRYLALIQEFLSFVFALLFILSLPFELPVEFQLLSTVLILLVLLHVEFASTV